MTFNNKDRFLNAWMYNNQFFLFLLFRNVVALYKHWVWFVSVHTKSLLLIVDIRGMKRTSQSSFGVSEKKESEMEEKKTTSINKSSSSNHLLSLLALRLFQCQWVLLEIFQKRAISAGFHKKVVERFFIIYGWIYLCRGAIEIFSVDW